MSWALNVENRNFFVFTNLAISMDGKIASRDSQLCHLGSAADQKLMQHHRKRADAILMGAATLRTLRKPALIHSHRKRKQPVNVILCRHLDFDPSWDFFTHQGVQRILLVGSPSSSFSTEIKASFQSSCKLIFLEESSPAAILKVLGDQGLTRILIEGGGDVLFPFARDNLIDEWNLTLTPLVIGGRTAPSLVGGEGLSTGDFRKYSLKKSRRKGDELFLVYSRKL